jgi:hypothetical protein
MRLASHRLVRYISTANHVDGGAMEREVDPERRDEPEQPEELEVDQEEIGDLSPTEDQADVVRGGICARSGSHV